ncbi:FAD binding domain protein [Sclerotinia borealis F-4128]|uniref:FAD binding domain protein n=1 Tax=Sclerotinia borealis (strain F-4128) TaxID=1432307 RepID=W9CEJ6_SCLBF|nr:FAD binding domain protein [Sclerotinia borealis F-4128]
MPLRVLVVGAGLAGLAAALSTKLANPSHEVTILETVSELAEVGAGLQITPNASRLFKIWGIYNDLAAKATFPKTLSVWRYDGTKRLAHSPDFQEKIDERYGAPFWGMHRVDLQRALSAKCDELGVTIRLSSRVQSVDFENTIIILEGGKLVEGDVILCTDGIYSATRSQFLGHSCPASPTGDLAYRIVIDKTTLSGPDAEKLTAFIDSHSVNFWAGPNTHVVSYTMRGGDLFNIVLLCPDNLPPGLSRSTGDIEEMKGLFEGWDPILRAFLAQVKEVEVAKWRLKHLETLSRWTSKRGNFWMAGDACHPMLPYLAQGANSSLEDGAVMGFLLGKVGKVNGDTGAKEEQLGKAAKMYEGLRKGRGERIARETWGQRESFHLVEGEAQVRRDEILEAGPREGGGFPSRWQDFGGVQGWLYGYDAYGEAERGFEMAPF